MAAARGLAEIVLMVKDVEESLGFYRDTLGLKVISPPEMKRVAFLQVGEDRDGVPQQIVLSQRPPDAPEIPAQRAHRSVHHIGFEVAQGDYAREQERLKGLGFDVRTGEHPFLPVEAFYIDDPDGNEVELVARK